MKRFPSEVIPVSKALAQGGVYPFETGLGIISYFSREGTEMGNKGEKKVWAIFQSSQFRAERVKVLADGCGQDCAGK